MTEISIKNEQAQFEALQKASQDIADQCNKIEVLDQTSLAIARQQLSLVNSQIKMIEDIRANLKKPYWDAGVAIDALAKPLKAPLETALSIGKSKILAYENAEQKKKLAEKKRIQAIKDDIQWFSQTAMAEMDECNSIAELDKQYDEWVRNFPGEGRWFEFNEEAQKIRENLRLYASQRKIQILNPQQADEEAQEMIKEVIQEEVAVVAEEDLFPVAPIKGLRTTWKFELVDISKVPLEWLMVDEKKVKEWLKDNSRNFAADEEICHGLKFYKENSVTIR